MPDKYFPEDTDDEKDDPEESEDDTEERKTYADLRRYFSHMAEAVDEHENFLDSRRGA